MDFIYVTISTARIVIKTYLAIPATLNHTTLAHSQIIRVIARIIIYKGIKIYPSLSAFARISSTLSGWPG